MDKVLVSNLEVWLHIGITPEEREEKQRLFVDIELSLNLEEAGITDNLEKSIDYSKVCDKIRLLDYTQVQTIEAFAERISKAIKQTWKPDSMMIRVKKPGSLVKKGARYGAVEIYR